LRGGEERRERVAVRDVERKAERVAAQRRSDCLGGGAIDVADRDASPRRREALGDRLADSLAASGNGYGGVHRTSRMSRSTSALWRRGARYRWPSCSATPVTMWKSGRSSWRSASSRPSSSKAITHVVFLPWGIRRS